MARGFALDSVLHARTRALLALACFGLGTLLGPRVARGVDVRIELYVLGGAGLLLAIAMLAGPRMRGAMLACSVVLLGMGWVQLRVDPLRPDRVGTIVGEMDAKTVGVPIEVRGVVREPSRIEHRTPGLADPPMWPERSNRALLEVDSLLVRESDARSQWVDASGALRLVLPIGVRLHAGERIELLGNFTPTGARRNPGEPRWAMLAAQSGQAGMLVIDQPEHVRAAHAGGLVDRVRSLWWSARSTLRTRALASIGIDESQTSNNASDNDASGMRAALLLGHREARFDEVFTRFQRVGVAHVLAISGFHLALVVLMLALGVRLLGEHPRLEALAVIITLVAVVVLIPLRPPIVRAAVIVGAMLLATRIGRRYDRMTILAWVGLGLLIWRPLDASSMGYQLSMGVTALLVLLSNDQQRALLGRQAGVLALSKPNGALGRTMRWCWGLLKMNLACWAVALPVVAYHAGVVGVLAPLVSVVIVPMIALLMALGYVQILIGIVWPSLAQRTLWLVESPSDWTLGFVSWMDSLAFAWVRVPAVSAWWAVLATIVVVLLVTRRIRWYRPVPIALMLVVLVLGFVQPALMRPSAPFRAVMLDVGDGSCVLLQSGRHGMIWDCGSLDRRVGRTAAHSARAMGITTLHDAIVTHDNLDHYNGLPELAAHTDLRRVWITTRLRDDPSPAWTRVRDDLLGKGIKIHTLEQDQAMALGEMSMVVLWPDAQGIDGLDDNDTSAVALVQSRTSVATDPAVLLTGDIEGDSMARIRLRYPDLPERINGGAIELPHHGSARAAAYDFIAWLDPGVVLQSTGPSRLDDDRWAEQRAGRAWLATARRGAAWVTIERDGRIGRGYWFDEEDE